MTPSLRTLVFACCLALGLGGAAHAQTPDTTAPAPDALPSLDGSVIEPATLVYETSIEAQGRQASATVRRTIEAAMHDGRAVWRVVDQNQSGMGAGADTFLVDRQTLAPVQRNMSGQGRLMVSYTDTTVTGSLQARGRSVSIDASLDGPILGDGPALEIALAALPLTDAYSTTFRIFNPVQQSTRTMQFTVTGTRTVQVPGGTFKTYVAELGPTDADQGGETLYLKQTAPHHVVKGESDLPPQMGSGSATRVLRSMDVGPPSGSGGQ